MNDCGHTHHTEGCLVCLFDSWLKLNNSCDGEPTTADEYNETWIKSKEKNDD